MPRTLQLLPLYLSTAFLLAIALAVSLASGGQDKLEGANEPQSGKKKLAAFEFVQMCDTQLGTRGYEHDVKMFKAAVEKINSIEPDFVVICGDLVNRADEKSLADFNSIKAKFKMPCHCAPGNHDVENKPTAESLKKYREKVGKDYFSFEHEGYTFVVANTQLWKAPLEIESEKHDTWFRKTLASAKAKGSPAVLVFHYPLFIKEPDEKEQYLQPSGGKAR